MQKKNPAITGFFSTFHLYSISISNRQHNHTQYSQNNSNNPVQRLRVCLRGNLRRNLCPDQCKNNAENQQIRLRRTTQHKMAYRPCQSRKSHNKNTGSHSSFQFIPTPWLKSSASSYRRRRQKIHRLSQWHIRRSDSLPPVSIAYPLPLSSCWNSPEKSEISIPVPVS